jgi:hypothetical protein
MLRHVVLFSFKASAHRESVAEIEAAFARLPEQIDLIRAYEWGTNVSPEGIDRGYTHCFLLTFASTADRDAYLVHPAHQAFVANLQPVLEQALVIDYWAAASPLATRPSQLATQEQTHG